MRLTAAFNAKGAVAAEEDDEDKDAEEEEVEEEDVEEEDAEEETFGLAEAADASTAANNENRRVMTRVDEQ